MYETIGFLETNSIAKGIEAADAILKAAETELIFSRAGCPGKYYILFTGEVAAVNESINCGINTENAVGMVVSNVVIPNPRPEIFESLM